MSETPEESRNARFQKEQKAAYINNAKELYDFCIDVGCDQDISLKIATLPLTIDYLEWAWETVGPNVDSFIRLCLNKYRKIETNRLESMH